MGLKWKGIQELDTLHLGQRMESTRVRNLRFGLRTRLIRGM